VQVIEPNSAPENITLQGQRDVAKRVDNRRHQCRSSRYSEPTAAQQPETEDALMIIWTRWGILVLLAFGLSVGTGFLLKALIAPALPTTGPSVGVFVGVGFLLGGVYVWLLWKYLLVKVLDKPRPLWVNRVLAEPIVHPNGARQTYERVAIRHPDTGEPIVHTPVSSFFFIPVRYWMYLIPILGVIVLISNLIALATQ
jgi:hypothetical protein